MLIHDTATLKVSAKHIAWMKFITYLRTGYILHGFSILVFTLFLLCFSRLQSSAGWSLIVFALLSMFLFSITITSQLDAYSRYQNYKLAKDLMYQNGCRILIMKPLSRSRCQRDALAEAAHQLGLHVPVKQYFNSLGYRWYHVVPSVLIENPLVILTRSYWFTTFFVPTYKSKYFYW